MNGPDTIQIVDCRGKFRLQIADRCYSDYPDNRKRRPTRTNVTFAYDLFRRTMGQMHGSQNLLFSTLWPGLTAWTVLYISDYSLTLICARLYRRTVNEKIVFEGSFELNPYFQRDIDTLKVVSPRFLAALIISSLYLAAVWWLAVESQPGLYEFVLGLMISSELAVHVRHVRNLFFFHAIAHTDGVHGQIRYSRPLILRMSSVELFAFSALFAVLFVFTLTWFVLGGAIGCLSIALKHLRLARKQGARGAGQAAAPVLQKEVAAGAPQS